MTEWAGAAEQNVVVLIFLPRVGEEGEEVGNVNEGRARQNPLQMIGDFKMGVRATSVVAN